MGPVTHAAITAPRPSGKSSRIEFATTTGHARSRIATLVRHHHFHDYAADRFARGAYSYTRVGGHEAADQREARESAQDR